MMRSNDANWMANSVDSDQTLGAVWSRSTLFVQAYVYLSENLGSLKILMLFMHYTF